MRLSFAALIAVASLASPLTSQAAPQTILFIGDSHSVQSFGRNLDSMLRTLPETRVGTYASWGTSPVGWFSANDGRNPYFEHDADGKIVDEQRAPTPVFSELLARYQPTLTIIELGSNLFGYSLEYAAKSVYQMAEMTAKAHSACIWVGPPDSVARSGPQMDELYGVLRGAATPFCQFVDSRKFTHYPATGGDGLHYDYLGADGLKQTKDWATKVLEMVQK